MLKNVKSSYFVIKVFSFIDEKQKLKLIKYNKSLQKNINISIINYIHFQGKYIIYKTNKKGKEYNNKHLLIYEGEYLNGERNGKGKEYNCFCKLEFEGEYLNGKRNGKGKEYNINGGIQFEGEYLNDERYGIGKDYSDNELFEGIYLNGKIFNGLKYDKLNQCYNLNGKLKEYYFNGELKYEGEYLNGKRNGKGIEYNIDGNIQFDGEYLNDKIWKGKIYDNLNNTISEINNGKGHIKEFDCNGYLIFKGEYLNGERNGKGKEYDYSGIEFEGEYLNGKRNGKGKEFDSDGNIVYEGEYLYGFKIKGKYYKKRKLNFEGEFRYDKIWNGKSYDENGNIIYELKNGKRYIFKG